MPRGNSDHAALENVLEWIDGCIVSSTDQLQFGEFSLDPSIPTLMSGSSLVELPPKALDVLVVLLRNAGRVVLNRDLLDLLWPDTAVEEGNIAVYVSYLRRALGDGRRNRPTYIETVPRRGYRFVATVQQVTKPDPTGNSYPTDLGLSAMHYLDAFTMEGCRTAAALLRRHIQVAPDRSWARAMLALSLLMQRLLNSASDELLAQEVWNVLNEAESIDPSCSSVHGARALWGSGVEWRWDQAEEQAQQAVELSSDKHSREVALTTLGCYLIRRGDIQSGFLHLPQPKIERCLCPLIWITHGDARFLARDFVGSLAALEEALHFHPHHWLLHLSRARALAALNDLDQALRSLRRARLLYEGSNSALDAEIVRVKALMGKPESAISLLRRRELSPIVAARVLCALGDKDGALARIREACTKRDWYVSDLKQDCRFDGLRSDSRFKALLASVGI